jgi:FlaA1/EpsC-like NDP-sugar epimerase
MNHDKRSGYLRFGAMILISMVVMYGVMYLNTYELADVRWSETRLFMTLLMGATMAVIMLGFMRKMFSDKRLNIAIYVGSVIVFLIALFLVRSQITVGDSAYMSAMIPHHSIAILTSERAQIEDVRVRELADQIIEAQRREIAEMNWLLEDIRQNGVAATQADADARPVPEFEASP